ncbi:sigma-70 family RNA polymerase sigma factor [Streptomyces sp. NPDC001691]|uniref:sigma-70 family RNA polymerase sigma factor n=1 Tax=unclassified Streptomyces TaxID=2593676 RepID=UPI000DEA6F70|nr:sigma-70 family RNA polymerase sigma factor [Streptomyces sp. SDr-06]RCH67271.1 sigma-70 family RNA polymerase sigma factor [Streptomyces sp. SDr-06]
MDLVTELSPLLAAEAAAEAPGTGVDAADLEQAVWLRLLEQHPADPVHWVRTAVRAEARRARRLRRHERPYASAPAADPDPGPELAAITAERRRVLHAAIGRTPGNCPRLLAALLSPKDPTYREIAGELDISQGSLGPMRSRCLGCLRRMLAAEVAAPERGGKER